MTQPGREGSGREGGKVGEEMGGTEEGLKDEKRTRGRESGKVYEGKERRRVEGREEMSMRRGFRDEYDQSNTNRKVKEKREREGEGSRVVGWEGKGRE